VGTESPEREPVFVCEKEMTRKIYIKAYYAMYKKPAGTLLAVLLLLGLSYELYEYITLKQPVFLVYSGLLALLATAPLWRGLLAYRQAVKRSGGEPIIRRETFFEDGCEAQLLNVTVRHDYANLEEIRMTGHGLVLGMKGGQTVGVAQDSFTRGTWEEFLPWIEQKRQEAAAHRDGTSAS
jgi:hypothetical protein